MAPQAERALRSAPLCSAPQRFPFPPPLGSHRRSFSLTLRVSPALSSQASSNIELLSPKNRVRAGLGPPGAAGVVG